MAAETDWWYLLPRPLRALPADLAAVLLLAIATNLAVFLPVVQATGLRVVLGLPFVLLVPGYAFIAALFPEDGHHPSLSSASGAEDDSPEPGAASDPGRGGIDGLERVALSVGTSIAIVPLVGLVLNFTPFGIRLVPIMVSLTALTVLCTAVGAHRRWDLPAEDRFHVPYREWGAAARAELLHPDSRADAALNALLAVSVVLAASSVGYAVLVPQEGEQFSEFYLLTRSADGDLVADDYPTQFEAGEQRQVIVGIGNHEHQAVNYTVVVQVQAVRIETNATRSERTADRNGTIQNFSLVVQDNQTLQRFSTRVEANGTFREPVSVQPALSGENLRLVFLLYRGDVPRSPTVENAYRELHLWINVSR